MKKLTLSETLELNKQQRRSEVLERARQQRKQENIEFGLALLIGVFIVISTLIILSNYSEKAYNQCINAGHSEMTCKTEL